MTLDWAACALVMAAASLVLGLAGFGNALVAMAFLPYFMPPATAIAVLTIYTVVFAVAIFLPVRRHLTPRGVAYLLVGTVLGTPLGVWIIVTCPASVLNRPKQHAALTDVAVCWKRDTPLLYKPDSAAGTLLTVLCEFATGDEPTSTTPRVSTG